MKNLIRFLCFASFFIFTLPFFDSCTSSLQETKREELATPNNSEILEKEIVKPIENKVAPSILGDGWSMTAYELAVYIFYVGKIEFKDFHLYVSICFISIMVLSVISFYYSIKKKYLPIYRVSILSILLLGISVIFLTIENKIEYYTQFKIGYFILAINLFSLIFISRKQYKNKLLNIKL